MQYRAIILIDPLWSSDGHDRARALLLHRMARDAKLPVEYIAGHATIEEREMGGHQHYVATIEIETFPQIDTPDRLAQIGEARSG